MKKLVFMFVAIAAMSFASCNNKSNEAAPATDSDSVQVDSAAVELLLIPLLLIPLLLTLSNYSTN